MFKRILCLTVLTQALVLFLAVSSALAVPYQIFDLAVGGPAKSINNSGQIVMNTSAAFLYENGILTDLGTLGGIGTLARDINKSGQIAGSSNVSNLPPPPQEAFLYDENGIMSGLGNLGGSASSAHSINDSEQIVGNSEILNNAGRHAFLYENGNMTDLGTLGGSWSGALGINNNSQIVGWSWLAGGNDTTRHAFLCDSVNGMMDIHGLLGGTTTSTANDINDNGSIVGDTNGSAIEHAWLLDNSGFTDIGTLPGDVSSVAHSINNMEQVVGASRNGSGHDRAFLYEGGVMTNLGTLGGNSSIAYAINDLGWIVGESTDSAGSTHAVLWKPVPEPGTVALFGIGLVGFGRVALRQRLRRRAERNNK